MASVFLSKNSWSSGFSESLQNGRPCRRLGSTEGQASPHQRVVESVHLTSNWHYQIFPGFNLRTAWDDQVRFRFLLRETH